MCPPVMECVMRHLTNEGYSSSIYLSVWRELPQLTTPHYMRKNISNIIQHNIHHRNSLQNGKQQYLSRHRSDQKIIRFDISMYVRS